MVIRINGPRVLRLFSDTEDALAADEDASSGISELLRFSE